MPNSKALAALRYAILEEQITHSDAKKVLDRYQVFSAKLIDYQNGGDRPPTNEEFEAWRDDILLVWAIREKEIEAKSAALAFQQGRRTGAQR